MKSNTHIVMKIADTNKYLTSSQLYQLKDILECIEIGRARDGKPAVNSYYICNTDEPYADKVLEVILSNELDVC